MLKKILISVGVLSLFVAIFVVHAQPSVHKLKNTQYVDALALPWFDTVEEIKSVMEAFYSKPKDATWNLRINQFEVATPYYKQGVDEYELPIELLFTDGILRSIRAEYANDYYETLVKRIQEDFTDGGFIETSNKIFHTYQRIMEEDGIKVTVEIVYDKDNQEQLTFDATCEKFAPPKEKVHEPEQKIKKHRVDVRSAAC